MSNLKEIFAKDFSRTIETVIKADDQEHVLQEVEEYVITKDVSNKLANFFEAYTGDAGTNGVWISGFFGCGKSHLLKILGYVLENKQYQGKHLGELFANKVTDDVKLKGDIQNATRKYHSESILFNIDQQAQITAKTDANAILQVFYKVFYDHQGFYGFQPHVAEFEGYLSKEGKYESFKTEFNKISGKDWREARKDYVDPLVSEAIAEACGKIYNQDSSKYEDYLDSWEDKQKFSIEDFALRVNNYIQSKGANFRLNFLVDEVGQYIAENKKLMLNLQTIAESLDTKTKRNSWVIVTSQEDLESLIGDDTSIQSDDFSKIQGRFRIRTPLTSANVDEVIEKRLLEKNVEGTTELKTTYTREKENLKTLLSFSEAGVQFKGYQGETEFVNKYPFIPYQFDLFQQCIKGLSKHNAFQGKHQSVGERSMLGVFQEVLKNANFKDHNSLVTFDSMYEGIKASLRSEIQNSILLATKQLSDHPLAIKVLKVLFLVKYYDNFKTTSRNISVLLLDSIKTNPVAHHEAIEVALNTLEQQTYIQRKGDLYEYLTDTEKDVEDDIKNTSIDNTLVSQLLNELIFDGIIKDQKIKYSANKQEFDFTRKVDGEVFGRDKELKIEVVSTNSDNYSYDAYFSASTMGDNTLMIIKLPEDKRLIQEARMALKTDKYIKQNQSSSNKDAITQLLFTKGKQNRDRKTLIENSLNNMLGRAAYYLNGTEFRGSSSVDGRNKVIDAFQNLIALAYPKLQLLGSATLDENQLRLIMKKGQPDLFGGNDTIMSAPEKEILNLVERRKQQSDRTNLSDLKDHFSKKPYGWTQTSIWCVTALLFKRGKIEAKQDNNILDDSGFLDALNNNRSWLNTLVVPQVEFDRSQITLLKTVYKDAFNETNPYTEAKEVAQKFKEKAKEEESSIRDMLAQGQQYPFVKQLAGLADLLKKLGDMDYATLLTTIKNYEDELLDTKEKILDPIRQFWNSEQKNIYHRVNTFQTGHQANFEYIDTSEKEVLSMVQESPTPYGNNMMKLAKEAMDTLADKLKHKLDEEKAATVNEAKQKILQVQQQTEFDKLTPGQQDEILKPFNDIITKTKDQNFIANLQVDRNKLSNILTDQLNALGRLGAKGDAGTSKPKEQFINVRNVEKHVNIGKDQLDSEGDVDAYIKALKEVMMEQIKQHRKITLS